MYLNRCTNPSKCTLPGFYVNFEGLVHLLRCIRDNKTLGLEYYSDMNDAPVSDLLIQTSIKNENHLMDFSDSSWQDCPDNGMRTGAYIILYQGGKIYHGTLVLGTVDQPSAESEYNEAFTSGMALAHFRMLIHEFLSKYPDIFLKEAPLIVLDNKSSMCMAKNVKDTKHTRHIARRMNFLWSGKKCKMHKIDWWEGGMQWADIATRNVFDHD